MQFLFFREPSITIPISGATEAGGKTGFDSQETKLPTYWSTPFSKICLGMKKNVEGIDAVFQFLQYDSSEFKHA